jgi:hypothetical protein
LKRYITRNTLFNNNNKKKKIYRERERERELTGGFGEDGESKSPDVEEAEPNGG